MLLTDDQYFGLSKLEKWYRKYQHQFIDISGTIGTGTFELVQMFIERTNLDPREIMYLSFNQKQVLELADLRYHIYYINRIIYKYKRIVNFNSLPVVNPRSNGTLEYRWEKEVRKKIDPKYKLIVVFDSSLMDKETINDLSKFGLPVILLRDPMLLPSPNTYTFLRDPNISLHDIYPDYLNNPIVYFANMIYQNKNIKIGNYDKVNIIRRKQMNLYNLKLSDMNICMSNSLRDNINNLYREKILKQDSSINIVNERVIVMNDLYKHKITNNDEKRIKLYLTKGLVGNISKVNKHAVNRKYVPIELTPEFYFEPFSDLMLDRHYLNNINPNTRQLVPDEILYAQYAYALTPQLARLSHWDNVTIIADMNELENASLQAHLLYTAITRVKKSMTLII